VSRVLFSKLVMITSDIRQIMAINSKYWRIIDNKFAGCIERIRFGLCFASGFLLFLNSCFKRLDLPVFGINTFESFQLFFQGHHLALGALRLGNVRLHMVAGLLAADGKIDGPRVAAFRSGGAARRKKAGVAGKRLAFAQRDEPRLSVTSTTCAGRPSSAGGASLLWDGRGPKAYWWPRPRRLHLALA
jgi:hypothetical protein